MGQCLVPCYDGPGQDLRVENREVPKSCSLAPWTLPWTCKDCLESTPEHGGGDASEKLTEITNEMTEDYETSTWSCYSYLPVPQEDEDSESYPLPDCAELCSCEIEIVPEDFGEHVSQDGARSEKKSRPSLSSTDVPDEHKVVDEDEVWDLDFAEKTEAEEPFAVDDLKLAVSGLSGGFPELLVLQIYPCLSVLDFSRLRATCRAHAGKKAFLKHLFHLVQPRDEIVWEAEEGLQTILHGFPFLWRFGRAEAFRFAKDVKCMWKERYGNGIPALHARTFLELASISLTATSDKSLCHLCARELIGFLKTGDKRTRFKICMLLSQVEDCLAKLGRFGNQMVLSLVNLALAESFCPEENLMVRAEALRTLKKMLPSGRSAVRRFPYIMRLAQKRSEIPDLLLPDLDSLTMDHLSLYCQPEMLPFDWSFLSLFEHITGSFGRALGREPQQHSYLLGQNDLFSTPA